MHSTHAAVVTIAVTVTTVVIGRTTGTTCRRKIGVRGTGWEKTTFDICRSKLHLGQEMLGTEMPVSTTLTASDTLGRVALEEIKARETHSLAQLAGAAKVHDLDSTALGVAEQDVLRLKVTVDNAELRCGQEEQSSAQLLGKLACEVERDATEVGVTEQVIEVVGQQLKHQAQMAPEHEMPLQVHWKHSGNRGREKKAKKLLFPHMQGYLGEFYSDSPPWHCTSLAQGQAYTLLPGHRLHINPLLGPCSALQISTRQQIQSPPLHLLLCSGASAMATSFSLENRSCRRANGKPGGVARFSGMQWADYAQTKQERGEGESLQKYLGKELALLPGTGARNNLQRETQQQQGSWCWQDATATHRSRDLSCSVTLRASW
ncbi:putative beta-glucosidase I, partial [Varanus komodoensis]